MQFSSVSSHFCRPKNVIKVGSLFLSDFSAVAHEKLADKFHCVQRKEKYIVSDPVFYGKSIQEQHKLVMDQLPKNIRDEIDFETLAYKVDNMVHHVKLRKNVTFNLNIEPVTPQMYLDAGVTYFRMDDSAMSSMSAWRSADSQLKNFLSMYHLRFFDDHALRNRIVLFLRQNCCDDIELKSKLGNAWTKLHLACYYAYGDLLSMENIWDSLVAAEYFCNFLHLIYEQKYFNAYAFFKWLTMRMEKHYLKMLIVKYEKENPNSQAKKLFCLKEILLMNEVELIKFIEEIYGKLNEEGADMEILNFQLNEAEEMLNLIKEKRV